MRIITIVVFMLLLPYINGLNHHSTYPDLTPITLQTWWGPINTTTGVFIYYEVINNGSTFYSDDVIILNISFYTENNTLIGYVNQHPLFFPNIWFHGERLGGNIFYNLSNKPREVIMIVDSNRSIPEEREDNNIYSSKVKLGVIVEGFTYMEGKPLNSVEVLQVDNNSLCEEASRRYYSNETGYYIATLPPLSNNTRSYTLMACNPLTKTRCLGFTPLVQPGDSVRLDFTFTDKTPITPIIFSTPITRTGLPHRIAIISKCMVKVDWGDGNYSNWSTTRILSHTWFKPGLYRIRVITMDSNGMLSKWSKPFYLLVIPPSI